jgi:hypothetical protein
MPNDNKINDVSSAEITAVYRCERKRDRFSWDRRHFANN